MSKKLNEAVRQQEYRDDLKKARRPTTHAVDSAITQAVAYTSIELWADGHRRDVCIPFHRILYIAVLILAHRERYDRDESASAVKARVRNMDWRFDPPKRPGRA